MATAVENQSKESYGKYIAFGGLIRESLRFSTHSPLWQYYLNNATISSARQQVDLSVSGIPKAASYFWASSSLFDSVSGVKDKLAINTTKTTPAGTYSITVIATGPIAKLLQ
jgi:hypothetical protein